MYKTTVKTQSLFTNEEQETTLYFNLTRPELLEFETKLEGGIGAYAQKIFQENDRHAIFLLFQDLILSSYGVRDGNAFVKTEEFTNKFQHGPEYDSVLMEIITNTTAMIDFFKGIMPKELDFSEEDVRAAIAEAEERHAQ